MPTILQSAWMDNLFAGGIVNRKLCVLDWKRGTLLQKHRAHDKGPSIGWVWHPVFPSTVFSCGRDGKIKIWL